MASPAGKDLVEEIFGDDQYGPVVEWYGQFWKRLDAHFIHIPIRL